MKKTIVLLLAMLCGGLAVQAAKAKVSVDRIDPPTWFVGIKSIPSVQLMVYGQGIRDAEVTRKDSFVNPYMGKDYGGSAFELLSMGIEGVIGFTDRVNLDSDEDMRNWITGILLAY